MYINFDFYINLFQRWVEKTLVFSLFDFVFYFLALNLLLFIIIFTISKIKKCNISLYISYFSSIPFISKFFIEIYETFFYCIKINCTHIMKEHKFKLHISNFNNIWILFNKKFIKYKNLVLNAFNVELHNTDITYFKIW